jgi:hypothetical protein
MTVSISFQPIPILIDGHDTQGQLVLAEGQLVAVVSRIDGETHAPEVKGQWHLEAGFGPCQDSGGSVFRTLDEAGAWVGERIGAKRRLLAGQGRIAAG